MKDCLINLTRSLVIIIIISFILIIGYFMIYPKVVQTIDRYKFDKALKNKSIDEFCNITSYALTPERKVTLDGREFSTEGFSYTTMDEIFVVFLIKDGVIVDALEPPRGYVDKLIPDHKQCIKLKD